ncbi:hypothetical protein BCR37DRAFT_76467 [Protomyces lactucae-debilis]|uniref:AMP-dependent synthetase/ligase domain-containing protein n=1 Tax=Protomyces lactucae-debilis TaxID=2754530 RepID=A0A1Y2F7L9_PROLT|nr:uncharacterized protein BCR37DRAFT_76467 [Protomyces lactucae-debilis]ORY79873.1 hypothetical protein BCR37DRAFT_76467 [Protomyces lactucae-debilis]
MPSLLTKVAIGALGAAYLDAKLFLAADMRKILEGYTSLKGAKAVVEAERDHCSAYQAIDLLPRDRDNEEAMAFEGRRWTRSQMRRQIARIGNELLAKGIKNRDNVVVLLNNSPEFVFLFWAMLRLGIIPVLVNTSLGKDRLRSCVVMTHPVAVITSYELLGGLVESLQNDELLSKVIVYDYNTYPASPFDHVIVHDQLPDNDSGDVWVKPSVKKHETAMMLFTSGSTGLPKASSIPAHFTLMCSLRQEFLTDDTMYLCLPLFHGTATLIGLIGATSSRLVLARRFSSRQFWQDVRAERCTVTLYIGEMIRYLLQQPENPLDSKNDMRMFYGLGLGSPSDWNEFRRRFDIPCIVEYYGSTEGTGTFTNRNYNSLGAGKCGHKGPLLRAIDSRVILVRHDLATGELIREKDGLCRKVALNEPGEALTMVDDLFRPHDYWDNAKANNEKVVRNVLKQGDAYVRMGDLLAYDNDGFVGYLDRLGDSYRVKGHNVSTTEIEVVIRRHPLLETASVYPIKNQGMMALVFKQGTDPEAYSSAVNGMEAFMREAGLPAYMLPRYCRVVDQVDVTSTFKMVKVALKAAGTEGDHVYELSRGNGYKPLASAKL